jgi:hypothetical protein
VIIKEIGQMVSICLHHFLDLHFTDPFLLIYSKQTSKPSSFNSDTSSYGFYTDPSDDSSDDLADLFEKAMEDIDKRIDKLYRTVKKRFFPND